jgi:NitT/TauT family transport system substrate-binding protein
VGCGYNAQELKIYMPDGAPALAMSKLMYERNNLGYDNVDYTVVSSSNISHSIIQRKADIAILPINMASKILKNGDAYKVVASVTNGNLYIVGNRDIDGFGDLTNEVVGVIGEGNVPDLNLKCLLNSCGVEYASSESAIDGKIALRYFADAGNLIPMLKHGEINFGLLPEPAVSKLLSIASNFNIELDIQELWEGGSYPQAVLVVKKELCQNTYLINNIISALKDNESWIISNPSLAVQAINNNLDEGVVASLQTTISTTTIANCNIRIVSTTESGEVARMKSYLEKIRSVAPQAIGDYTDNLFYIV